MQTEFDIYAPAQIFQYLLKSTILILYLHLTLFNLLNFYQSKEFLPLKISSPTTSGCHLYNLICRSYGVGDLSDVENEDLVQYPLCRGRFVYVNDFPGGRL